MSLDVFNNMTKTLHRGNSMLGLTRGFAETFLAEDRLPIYASTLYQGDNSIADVKKNRDNCLTLFHKEPGQINLFVNPKKRAVGWAVEGRF